MTIQLACLRHFTALAMALAAASSALAQGPAPTLGANGVNGPARVHAARLRVLEGNVLLGQDAGLGAVEGSVDVPTGGRIITMAGARASLSFDDECTFDLSANQRLVVVDSSKPCAQRVLVESIQLDGQTLVTAAAPEGGASGALGGGNAGLGSSTAGGAGQGAASSGAVGVIGALGAGAIGGPVGALLGVAGLARVINSRSGNTASPN